MEEKEIIVLDSKKHLFTTVVVLAKAPKLIG
jgi:hypothetical protein